MTEEGEQAKDHPVNSNASQVAADEEETEEFTFDMSMKKKKKKKKPLSESKDDLASHPGSMATVQPVEEAAMGEGGDGVAFVGEEGESTLGQGGPASALGEEGTWQGTDRDYTYHELLGRVFSILRQNNPDLAGDRRKFTIIPPIIGREGSKKTAFANIAELCRRMRRPIEHVTSFLLTEMGTTGSMDGNQRLIIKGRFQQLQVENLLRRYIGEYVTCKTCRSPETQLAKENRLFFMKCDSCGSSRSVTAIKAGFKAQTGRRIKAP